MTKLSRRKLRNGRDKALFGEAAATLTAAGIGAAATLGAAAWQASATKEAAKKQAEAARKAAEIQAEALDKQNEIANQNQEKQINFTKAQNERNRDLQKEIQMNLQMLTGQQNENDRLDAAKIQVKCGGSMRRKLKNAGAETAPYFLRGRNGNLPFTVTDGGGVLPIATTPEGYDLYEIVGNDHEHYHKAQGGKSKTGVGIRFAGRKTIEGEGNQNTNQGELMLVTPTDAKFISKHSIKGFNPTKAVLAGVHPIDAFNKQEELKATYGISDDGNSSPVKGMRAYTGANITINPDLSLDFLAPVATGVVYGTRRLKNGGRLTRFWGGPQKGYYNEAYDLDGTYAGEYAPTVFTNPNTNPTTSSNVPVTSPAPTTTPKGMSPSTANMIGAGITSLGNIGGAIISTIGNNAASRTLQQGYNSAANILANAYGNLRTIDASMLRRSDFSAPHAMAAIRNPYVNINPELALIERGHQRRLSAIRRNSLSSAAALNRLSRAETDAYDMRSQVFSRAEQQREGIRQGNVERITQVANENANRDAQANRDYTNAYLTLLQYNNDIENEKITGAAQARADALTQNSTTIAGTNQANAATWAGTVSQIGLGFGNTLATNAKMANELDMTLLGASMENQVMYYLDHPNAPGKKRFLKILKNSSDPKYKKWYNALNS